MRLRALALLPALLAAALQAQSQDASFVAPGKAAVPVRALERDGRTLLSVHDVVTALEGVVGYDAPHRSYEIKLRGHSAVFGAESSIVVVDTRLVQLSVPVVADGAHVYADLEFFQKTIGALIGVSFAWEKATRVLTAHRADTPEVAVEVSVADFDTTTKVVFRFSQPPTYRVEKGDGVVLLRFPGVRLAAGPERPVDDPRVARLQIRGSEAAVFLKDKTLSTNVYSLGAPPRIVLDITQSAPLVAPLPAPVTTPGAAPTPETRLEPKTVVLDPGHGGSEEGARGPDGLLEKDATLSMVKVIREVLTRRGYHVVTTRDSDVSVGLEDRAASANAAHADVFLSIHCNAGRTPTAHGTEVYYLSLDATDRAAAAVAEKENAPQSTPSTAATPVPVTSPTPSAAVNAALRDLDLILWDLAQNQHLAASSRLAEIVQGDFNRLLGVATRGVKQAPFKVLIGVNAPAVLVEVAFITNPDEEKKLSSEEFKRQVAETLAGSLETFFKRGAASAPVPYAPGTPR